MSEHTEGPWRIEADVAGDQDIAIVAGDPRCEVFDWAFVAHVCGPEVPEDVTEAGGFDRAEAIANARLIACAPDLLAAARVLVDEANSFGWSGKGLKGYTVSWTDGRPAHEALATLRRIV